MNVYVDISPYWLSDENGNPRSVNSVYEAIRGSENEVGRNTLTLALAGTLDRGYFLNLIKLARLCSEWSGRAIAVDDLLKIKTAPSQHP